MRATVLMPVYNGERYIRATLESIVHQSMRDFELLIVDDGSTDRTVEIISVFLQDSRIQLVSIQHGGICAALNEGLRRASGEWIIRIDADDLMLEKRIERQLAFLDSRPEISGAGSFYEIIDEEGRSYGSAEPPLTTPDDVLRRLRTGQLVIFPHPTMAYRRDVALQLGGYREEYRRCEDVDLFVRMIEAGHMLIVQPEYLTRLRFHSRSESARNARAQTILNELIFENNRRRRGGEREMTLSEYEQKIAGGLIGRLFSEMRVLSEICVRQIPRRENQGAPRGSLSSDDFRCLARPAQSSSQAGWLSESQV
jgi:glycosyltransferase involved in cell wall biosynthesis